VGSEDARQPLPEEIAQLDSALIKSVTHAFKNDEPAAASLGNHLAAAHRQDGVIGAVNTQQIDFAKPWREFAARGLGRQRCDTTDQVRARDGSLHRGCASETMADECSMAGPVASRKAQRGEHIVSTPTQVSGLTPADSDSRGQT
jgi:hypothetical protein